MSDRALVGRLVSDYKDHQADDSKSYRLKAWLDYFKRLPSLAVAISDAAMAIGPGGIKHPHQWRRSRTTLERAREALRAVKDQIEQSKTFDDLLCVVDTAIRPIRDIADLTIYDAALRIGAFRRKLPTRVYLHAGAAEGYRKLKGGPVPGTAARTEFDEPIRSLKAYEIEDFLCIFKDKLAAPRSVVELDSCRDTGRPRRKIVC